MHGLCRAQHTVRAMKHLACSAPPAASDRVTMRLFELTDLTDANLFSFSVLRTSISASSGPTICTSEPNNLYWR